MTFAQNALAPLVDLAGRTRARQPQATGASWEPYFPQGGAMTQGNDLSFGEALGQSESGGRYDVVNSLGYTGKYQFGEDRLTDFNRANGGNLTLDQLRENPDLQEQVFQWHVADIDRFAADRGYLDRGFSQNQLRAVAHLGGKGGMARFVESGGEYNPSDAYGTSLSDYATRFR